MGSNLIYYPLIQVLTYKLENGRVETGPVSTLG